MSRYRKKPVVIDAMQFTGDNHMEVEDWATSNGGPVTVESAACSGDGPPYVLAVHTLEGRMLCGRGDWLIKGVQGEFYPCKPDIFTATYEPVEEARVNAVDRAIRDRLAYLRRELEIAEREAARDLLDVQLLPPDQRAPFDAVNAEILAARDAIPMIRAGIAELTEENPA